MDDHLNFLEIVDELLGGLAARPGGMRQIANSLTTAVGEGLTTVLEVFVPDPSFPERRTAGRS